MSKISSIRWNDETLYHHAQEFAELNEQKLNTLIMEAISEYLSNREIKISKLKQQTASFNENNFDLDSWSAGQDTQGWE